MHSYLGNVDAHSIQTFGFTNQLQNFLIKIDVQIAVVWMTND